MPLYLPRFLLNRIVRQTIQKKINALSDFADFRAYMNRLGKQGRRLPASVTITPEATSPQLVTFRPQAPAYDLAILYLHGGGYVFGSFETHAVLMAKLAQASAAPVTHVEYRLAPEHPFPAAVEDALFAYQQVRARYPAARLAVGGDSAGAGLTLALLQKLRAEQIALPDKIFLYSPWADLTGTAQAVLTNGPREYMLSKPGLHKAAAAYANGRDLTDPMLSPINGDYTGFPPMLVQFVPHELLADDARAVIAAARRDGVAVSVSEWPGNAHAFQTLSNLRDADKAIAETAVFLRAQR